MPKPTLLWILLALWVSACLTSLWYLFLAEPTGDGFVRGLNRLAGFVGWQLAAAALAMIAWWVGRGLERGSGLRWLSRVPGLFALLLVTAIAGLILWVRLSKPPMPMQPPGPVSAPAEDARPVE